MIIRCPNCHFEREIPLSSIPQTAVMATCPRCKTRFQFRNASQWQDEPASGDPVPAAGLHQEENDGLGQGAAGVPVETGAESPADSLAHAQPVEDASAGGEGQQPESEAKSARQGRGLLRAEPGDDPLPPGAIVNPSDPEPAETIPARQEEGDADGQAAESLQETEDEGGNAGSVPGAAGEEESGEDGGYKASVTPRLRGASNAESLEADVPWEKPRKYGNLNGFYQTLLRVMFHPVAFFLAVSKCRGKVTRPAIFYVILGMIQTIAQLVWIRVKIFPAMTDPNVQALWNSTATTLSISLTILLKVFILPVELYVYSALFFLMLRLVQPEKADFAVVLRVIAYSSAPLILYVVPVIGPLVGAVWFAGCCFVGCRIALGLPWIKVAMALGPLYLIAFAIMAQLCQHLGIL
ncbi:MAG: zinc-ribbon domain-containing protein [Desulfovibrionaceae bacterium]|nr:zinc-ribbon domain-containing protein [Desulfovibrionaceae bacterium]